MGHAAETTIVYVGLARLPHPLVTPAPSLAVELEVDGGSRLIVSATTNLPFPGLERLLREVVVGRPIDSLSGAALLELEVRYSAPFTSALRAAVQAAARRAQESEGSRVFQPEQRVAVSSA